MIGIITGSRTRHVSINIKRHRSEYDVLLLLRRAASARRVETRARDVMLIGGLHGRDVSVPYARGPTKNTAAARFVYGVVALGFPPTDTISGGSERRRHRRSPVAPHRQ